MNYKLILHSKSGRAGAVAILIGGLVFLAVLWQTDGFAQMLAAAVLPLGLAYFSWWFWAFPVVIASSTGVKVRNQFRTIDIPWELFIEAESRYGLYLHVKDPEGLLKGLGALSGSKDVGDKRRIYASGVPARGGFAASRKKAVVDVPELYFDRGPRLSFGVDPQVATRLLDEEKLYHDKPSKRPRDRNPSMNQRAEWALLPQWKRWLRGIKDQDLLQTTEAESRPGLARIAVRFNYLAVGIMVAFPVVAFILIRLNLI